MPLGKQQIQDIANGVPGAIERALKLAKVKIATYTEDNTCRCSPIQQHQMQEQHWQRQQTEDIQAS